MRLLKLSPDTNPSDWLQAKEDSGEVFECKLMKARITHEQCEANVRRDRTREEPLRICARCPGKLVPREVERVFVIVYDPKALKRITMVRKLK